MTRQRGAIETAWRSYVAAARDGGLDVPQLVEITACLLGATFTDAYGESPPGSMSRAEGLSCHWIAALERVGCGRSDIVDALERACRILRGGGSFRDGRI
ncbi:MAG TPA: hypothetical protein VN802_09665 [Stellaceae bacterium]|nr:hypothetical protein [Stellaceae bacterium]